MLSGGFISWRFHSTFDGDRLTRVGQLHTKKRNCWGPLIRSGAEKLAPAPRSPWAAGRWYWCHTRVHSPHICSALWPVSLLTRPSCYGFPAESVPSPECPVPSFDHRKSKCRKDIHFAASLRHHRESQDLQARSEGTALSGTFLLLVAPSILSPMQVQLDPSIQVR